jgi:hypothetical protein
LIQRLYLQLLTTLLLQGAVVVVVYRLAQVLGVLRLAGAQEVCSKAINMQ